MKKTYNIVIAKYGCVKVIATSIEEASMVAAKIPDDQIDWETTEVSNVEEEE